MKTKPNLLIATTSWPTNVNPSGGTFIKSFAESMTQYYDVQVIAPAAKEAQLCVDQDMPLKAECFRYAPEQWEVLAQFSGGIPAALKRNPWLFILTPLFLMGFMFKLLLKVREADYVQANWVFSGFAAVTACVLWRKSLVVTLHGEDARKLETSVIHRVLFWFVLHVSHRIVCVGEEMFTKVSKRYTDHEDKFTFISNGVSDELFDVERIKIDDGVCKLLMVASLVDIKSVDHALKSMSLLASSGVNAHLTIVGDGPLKGGLEALSETLGITARVSFLSVVSQKKLFKLYANNDILIICSREEGRSSVAMEAMAAGLLLVCSTVAGVRELIKGQSGVFGFDYGDIDQLCRAIVSAASTDHVKAGISNRQWMQKQQLSWAGTSKRYAELFS